MEAKYFIRSARGIGYVQRTRQEVPVFDILYRLVIGLRWLSGCLERAPKEANGIPGMSTCQLPSTSQQGLSAHCVFRVEFGQRLTRRGQG